jgi:hypothetical protein
MQMAAAIGGQGLVLILNRRQKCSSCGAGSRTDRLIHRNSDSQPTSYRPIAKCQGQLEALPLICRDIGLALENYKLSVLLGGGSHRLMRPQEGAHPVDGAG